MKTEDLENIKKYILSCSPETKFYIGADSQRLKKKNTVRYSVVLVCHINGKNGARVFGEITYEKIKDSNPEKPFNRLFLEAQKVVEFYEKLFDVLHNRDVELHIDINSKENTGSNIALNAAIGYVKGITGIDPKSKPEAWAASCAADQFHRL